MKKLLLGTTALFAVTVIAAPAFAAEKIQLQLRGYHVGAIAITDTDKSAGDNEINFGSDSEVHFVGSTTLDNGLQVSFHAELELEDDSDVDDDADQIDEVYIQFDGGFGRIQFGQNDGVMYQLHIAAPALFASHGVNQPDAPRLDPFVPYGLTNPISTYGEFSGDDIKISYFTPSFNGLQFGISYTPNPCKNDTGYAGCVGVTHGRNYWEVAGTWAINLDNIAIGLSVGYGTGEQGGAADSPTELTLGAEIGFGGITIGGSWADKETGIFGTEQNHWDIGIEYENGPWAIGLSYADADGDLDYAGAEDDAGTSFLGGIRYMYGPGMHIGLGFQTLEVEDAFGFVEDSGSSVFIENSIVF